MVSTMFKQIYIEKEERKYINTVAVKLSLGRTTLFFLSHNMSPYQKKIRGVWPCGVVVKFHALCLGDPSSQVQIPGADPHHFSATLWWQPTYKIEEDWHGC